MKIVIEIPNEVYEKIIKHRRVNQYDIDDIRQSVFDGTPLPEHHGRLIDADRLTRAEILHVWYHLPNGDIACPKIDIDHAPTIIEADKAESEVNADE